MRAVLIGGSHQLRHAGKHVSAQSFDRDVAEESLDHVQPRGRVRREMHVKLQILVQPCPHSGVLVGGVVIGDQVQRLALGSLPIDLAQKL